MSKRESAKRWANQRRKVMVGRRVRLISHTDPYSDLEPGDEGTVRLVDDAGTVHVNWDCGSSLGLVPGIDEWEMIRRDQE